MIRDKGQTIQCQKDWRHPNDNQKPWFDKGQTIQCQKDWRHPNDNQKPWFDIKDKQYNVKKTEDTLMIIRSRDSR